MNTKSTREQLADFATSYTLSNVILEWKGRGWGIYKLNLPRFAWNKSIRDFAMEPMPSNADEEFFESCRFNLDEAFDIAKDICRERFGTKWSQVEEAKND